MRTNLEFRSSQLSANSNVEGPSGRAVAELLTERLPHYGFLVESIIAEDWGWLVQVTNQGFPLSVGCGSYQEYPDGCLCFIEPSRRFVRRWLKRISTVATVERLADALEHILRDCGKAHELRWWSATENSRG
jgi:hypothetical protein